MGLEAVCVARWSGEASEGKLHMETDELRFSGAFRLKIPRKTISRVEDTAGALLVAWHDGVAEFELGDRAAKWREKILNPPSLADKLGVKLGTRVRVVGSSGDRFAKLLRTSGAEIVEDEADLAFAFVEDAPSLERFLDSLSAKGAIWVVYPKGRKEITEVGVLTACRGAGLVDTKVARFSETHTALRFVPAKDRR